MDKKATFYLVLVTAVNPADKKEHQGYFQEIKDDGNGGATIVAVERKDIGNASAFSDKKSAEKCKQHLIKWFPQVTNVEVVPCTVEWVK